MSHRRCTGCKEEVGRYGIRHKRYGGLFCEPCMKSLGLLHGRIRGFLSNVWSWMGDVVGFFIRSEIPSWKRDEKRRQEKIRVYDRVMAARALTIPGDPQSVSAH